MKIIHKTEFDGMDIEVVETQQTIFLQFEGGLKQSSYKKKRPANYCLKRIYFIMKFFDTLKDDESRLFVLDEVGFGTKPLRHYGYSLRG